MGIYSTYLSSHQEKNNSFIQYNSKAHLEPSQTSQMERWLTTESRQLLSQKAQT